MSVKPAKSKKCNNSADKPPEKRPHNPELQTTLQAARLLVSYKLAPYFSSLLYRVELVPKEDIGTVGVDDYWRLYYDPSLTWDVEEMATALVHEMHHLARDSAGRAKCIPDVQHMIWNLATDAELNVSIDGQPWAKWPHPPVLPKNLEIPGHPLEPDNIAEYYYEYMMKHAVKIEIRGVGSGDCGSCVHSTGNDDGEGDGEGKPNRISEIEKTLIRKQVAEEAVKHSESAEGRGTVPQGLLKWAKAFLKPVVDWRKDLMSALRFSQAEVSGQMDYTYNRIARKQSFSEILVPSMIAKKPKTAILFDTSGSMGENRTARGLAEVKGLLKQANCWDGVPLLSCDAAVHACKSVFSGEDIQLYGGGGTDMCIGLAVMNGDVMLPSGRRFTAPDLGIVITDGETPWPEFKPSNIKRLVIVIVDHRESDHLNAPKWANRIVYVPATE